MSADDVNPLLRSAEEEVFDLWEGGFDTFVIAGVLTEEGLPIAEAEVYRIIAAEQDRRYAARSAAPLARASS
ncbi:hypothetical protein [Methylobacterium sp. J-092]|uniref:hypothetical protein n=1 Tax=Methylobacterium sp. J-092 TaxID=2836667 RepID=UPI001FBBD63B|nr:hypothetical protein [Methylobacterium sp. J-092]MCJ2009782.1 hypothetical protein [Methylobacterium sp. J-092]